MLSANLWADMDNICFVNANAGMNKFNSVTWNHIRDNCERNNILVVFKIKDVANLMQFIPRYCRYDRAINKYLAETKDALLEERDMWSFDCVLYSNEMRKLEGDFKDND